MAWVLRGLQSMDDSVVDFPFRVSPAEQEIIEMDPQPPCPMLLVGRSGTGDPLKPCTLQLIITCMISSLVQLWPHA